MDALKEGNRVRSFIDQCETPSRVERCSIRRESYVYDALSRANRAGKDRRQSLSFSYSLSHLTILRSPPPQAIEIAERAGYDYVGLRLLPSGPSGIAYPLMNDKAAMHDTRTLLASSGVRVFDIESIRLEPETNPDDYLPLFEAGAELGARTVIASAFDPDPMRVVDLFATLCASAANFDLLVHLEFIPWSVVRTPAEARTVVEAAGQRNGRILLDALHLDRSGGNVKDLAGMDGVMDYFHLCDAPPLEDPSDDGLIRTARSARLLPGDGEIDLYTIVQNAPAEAVIGVEVPSDDLTDRFGAETLAELALQATRKVVANAGRPARSI
jgi:sugar phosphate isomerase/epimerase